MAGNSLGLFLIDKHTSAIYMVKNLDFETISLHYLKIARQDLSKPASIIGVKVVVLDENDNFPEFPEDPMLFSVAENAKIGSPVWTFNATDKDTSSNGRIIYQIEQQIPDEQAFEIDHVTGELKISGKGLDRERFSEYMLIVSATDQALNVSERHSTTVTTRIYVTDLNDNRPMFVSRDQVHVFEDEPVGYPLVYVLATDADWAENARVTYRLLPNSEKKFRLNETTGTDNGPES